MENLFNKHFFLTIITFCVITLVSAQQSDKIWQKRNATEIDTDSKIERRSIPTSFEIYHLNVNDLKQQLSNSPKRKGKLTKSSTVLSFPNSNGVIEEYEVFEASILDEALQNRFPNIKSYIGKNIDNPENIIRFSLSSIGLHAMIMKNDDGAVFIDPYTSNKESYIVYARKDIPKSESFECQVLEDDIASKYAIQNLSAKANNANDGNLRTFRLAIATTGEYSQFQLLYNGVASSASETEKKEAVLSAINATMTRVNAIFERDVSLTMKLVANNADVIFLDPETDGFTNDDGNELINESQTIIDANIGFSNYDIGHTFSTGGGGLATLNSPCTNNKAKGITGSSFPIGDTYDIDFVAHEMGHQYGANHTFNSEEGSCGGGNVNNGTAIEPGSGSTIMAYAGLCAPDNVQQQSDDYFHLVSIQEMWANISSGNSMCATVSSTGNSAPVLDDLNTYTLPISTPFVLNANATDADGDILTYTWEQLDNELVNAPPVMTLTEGPSFRSIGPSTSSMRYFPNQNTVSTGALFNTWEALPAVGRTMTFGVNVRDNNINGGQTASKETTLTFDENSGPFKVTSQTSATTWNSGENKSITWDVANTNNDPVNCVNVNILLSTDGGFSFPYTLATNVSNNGTATINVPNITTSLGRIKVQSVGNVFYALNESNISIQAKEFTINFSENDIKVCTTTNAIYNFTYNTFLGFNEVTTFSANGNPTGTTVSFNPATATTNNTNVQVTVSGINALDPATYTFDIIGTSGTSSETKTETLTLNLFDANIADPILTSPANNAINIEKPYVLSWDSDTNAESYEVEIATDDNFNNIIEQASIDTITYSPLLLNVNTKYYWRVKATNSCGTSGYSSVYNFTTANEICNTYNASDLPKTLPESGANTITSTLTVLDNKIITDVNVTVNIIHSWVSDLTLELISPKGISVLLSVGNGGDGNNYSNTIFDDSANTSIMDGVAPFAGTFRPQIPLSYLNDTEAKGNWVLKIVDSEDGDGGALNSWSIEICGIPTENNDDDNDGITNDIDLCPNTVFGNSVDALGCFKFPENNFNIETIGETCLNKANGEIRITTQKSYNYTTTIQGSVYNFTDSQTIYGLPSGTYDFCVSVFVDDENKTYEQCFTIVIEAGTSLAGKTSVKNNKVTVDISQGTAPFKLFINNNLVLTTMNTSFEIDIEDGDKIQIKSSIDCEGVLLKDINIISEIKAYPNPTKGLFEITFPIKQKEVRIDVFNIHSQLISSKNYSIYNSKAQLNIENNATGIYIVKVYLDEKPAIFKIVKH